MSNQFQPYGDLYVARLDGSGLRRQTGNDYEDGTPTWNSTTGEMDVGRLSVETMVGDRLMEKGKLVVINHEEAFSKKLHPKSCPPMSSTTGSGSFSISNNNEYDVKGVDNDLNVEV
uniref:Uncharacterized protein n=1 Tax=Nelumbo nucifera TaxID=4432 RepID=A0A822XWH5_NELNU|nr:TPA_asm: hypothetical protein HUJ06_024819 [Nelumbo nucifera]